MEHRVSYKVYYEDTDSLGVVYYANYLKYLERGRDIRAWNNDGYYFVVYNMNIRFRKSAELGDVFDVVTSFSKSSSYRAVFKQRIERAGEVLVEADVEIVCLDASRTVREFPALTTG
jgi:acyl-CoA thioester hydrolase